MVYGCKVITFCGYVQSFGEIIFQENKIIADRLKLSVGRLWVLSIFFCKFLLNGDIYVKCRRNAVEMPSKCRRNRILSTKQLNIKYLILRKILAQKAKQGKNLPERDFTCRDFYVL